MQGRGTDTAPNQQISQAQAMRTHDRQSEDVFMPRETKGGGLDGDASKEVSGAKGRLQGG